MKGANNREFREFREIGGSITTNPLISLNSLNSLEITLYYFLITNYLLVLRAEKVLHNLNR